MITNLVEYFIPEQEYYLDKISYNRIEKTETIREYSLNCIDNIETILQGDNVRVIVTRTLRFDPQEIFELSVSFGVILKFKSDKMKEYDWATINLSDEFRENGQFALGNLLSRITLLISEITSSYGQPPLILPPQISPRKKD